MERIEIWHAICYRASLASTVKDPQNSSGRAVLPALEKYPRQNFWREPSDGMHRWTGGAAEGALLNSVTWPTTLLLSFHSHLRPGDRLGVISVKVMNWLFY